LNHRASAALAAFRRRAHRASALGDSSLRPLAESLRLARAVNEDRLLQQPVFVLSSIRSGSTLLRVMLNTHSQIYSPHELHLRGLSVSLRGSYVTRAMKELGMSPEQLQFLLWDRLLHRELMRHGKQVLVNKTPNDAFIWRRIVRCWPDARFLFLLRHPAAITDSWSRARKSWTRDQVAKDVLRYMLAVEDARVTHGGLEVRYEDLTVDPARETQRICEFLGLEWEPAMLDYRRGQHGRFRAGLGDWSERIRSGEIQPVEHLPSAAEIPPVLVDISKRWGYLSG
jgi:hypothetical protein